MEEALQAGKNERTETQLGYRAGYYNRMLITRVGKVELRVPQDRQGRFRTEVFERYQRSEKALVAAMLEMYVQGVSTRKVKNITEELSGHEFSSATISRIVGQLDAELEKFSQRRLEEPYPYLVLDARYEKVREDGAVRSQAVLVAIGINWECKRSVLAVELASRESLSSWRELLTGLRRRSLHGIEFVVSDDHAGLRKAIQKTLPEAVWQRCYVHFCGTLWTICRAKRTMIACKSCAGSTIGVTPRKHGEIWRLGSQNGASATASCVDGSRRTSKKP